MAEALILRASITCLPSSPLEPCLKWRMGIESLLFRYSRKRFILNCLQSEHVLEVVGCF